MHTRIVLIALTGLLALPVAQMAAPLEAKNRSRTVTRTFRNTAPIAISTSEVSPMSANPYPAPIVVSGLKKGTIRDVNLTLNRFNHTFPDYVSVLLVGPAGQTAIVMANAGGSASVDELTLRLDDEAANPLPDETTLRNDTYRPTNVTDSVFPCNAPAPPVASANAALSVFDGSDPNGSWRLFVQDEYAPADSGVFTGGWELEITAQVKAKRKKR